MDTNTETTVDYAFVVVSALRKVEALTNDIEAVPEKRRMCREEWYAIGAGLLAQRALMPSNNEFGAWVKANGIDTGPAAAAGVRSDAMWLAKNWASYNGCKTESDSYHPTRLRQECREAGYSWALDQREPKAGKQANSQREPKNKPARKKVGLPAAVLESAGVDVPWGIRVNSSTKEVLKAVEDEYGKPLPKDVISGSEEAEEVVAAWMQAEIKANPKAHRAEVEARSLPEQYQQQVDLAINVYKAELQVAEEKRLAEAKRLFDEELKKQVSDLQEQLMAEVRKRREEVFVWQERSKTLDKWMSEEEFKKVQSFLHPDKHPQAMQAKASEAFQIFSRLKQHLEPDKRKLKSAASLWGAR